MTSRIVASVGWTVIAGSVIAVQALALATDRCPTIGDLILAITRRRSAQLICLAGWLWLGWHVFVRTSR